MNNLQETGCCPRFDPDPWQEKEKTFDNKLFIKDKVRSFMHMPLNFGKVMTRMTKKIEDAGAQSDDYLLLSDEHSPWRSDVYIAISKEIPGAEMEHISGNFLTKAYEGSYSNMGKWVKDMKDYMTEKGKDLKKMYFYYTTCPKCAKVYGKNYTVVFGQY